MPFWSSKNNTQNFDTDPALEPARDTTSETASHRWEDRHRSQGGQPKPNLPPQQGQYPIEAYYEPQRRGSETQYEPSIQDPNHPQIHVQVPADSDSGSQAPSQTIAGQPYERQYEQPPPSPILRDEPPTKRGLRSKLGLGGGSNSRENLGDTTKEHSTSRLFGRRKSLKRKDNPLFPSQPTSSEDVAQSGQWSARDEPQQTQQGSQQYDPYRQDWQRGQQQYQGAAYTDERPYRTSSDIAPAPPPHQQLQQVQYQAYSRPATQESEPGSLHDTAPQAGHPLASSYIRGDSRPDSRASSLQSHNSTTNPQQYYQQDYKPQLERLDSDPNADDQQHQQHQQSIQSQAMAPATGPRPRPDMKGPPPNMASRDASNLSAGEGNGIAGQGLSPNTAMGPGPANRTYSSQSVTEGEMRSRTPPPMRQASDMSEAEINQILRDYQSMKSKYNNVKRQYFEKKEQVDHLQNTLAHQRLSKSRTSLDDGEYIQRMGRLDGLINQLSFNIRKDWRKIPEWLQPSCSKDALQLGTKEMTAVGRAFISWWLVIQFFDKYFHPGLNINLSADLRSIQHGIRATSPTVQSAEEEEILSSKIMTWRLSTIEGLPQIHSATEMSTSNRKILTETLVKQLIGDMAIYLGDEIPAGLEGGVNMIIDLAVGILTHLPLESREVSVQYYPPGHIFVADAMRIETGLPPIDPIDTSAEKLAQLSSEESMKESSGSPDSPSTSPADASENTRRGGGGGFLSGLIGGGHGSKKGGTWPQGGQPPGQVQQGPAPTSGIPQIRRADSGDANQVAAGQMQNQRDDGSPPRVRMCTFMSLHIRGKMVLAKAPVYKM